MEMSPNVAPDGWTDLILDFVENVSFDELPHEVVDKAKLCVLDAVGCAVGGARLMAGQAAMAALVPGCRGKHVVIGTGETTSEICASFVNATLINALDFDDDNGVGHPTASILPAMIGAAERNDVGGRRFVEAFVAGLEAGTRIGRAIWPTPERYKQVWGVGTHQVFGATVGAAALHGLDRLSMADAFGIGGTGAPVPSAMKWGWDRGPLSWMKDAVAWPALAATVAVRLASAGFRGCHDILDGPNGFWVMASSDRFEPSSMCDGLGEEFTLLDVAFKPYPCCRYAHSTLDAILEITRGRTVRSEEIRSISVRSLSDLAAYMARRQPSSVVEAQFSVPFLVAATLSHGRLTPDLFMDERILLENNIREIEDKIIILADEQADEVYHETHSVLRSVVDVAFVDGSQATAQVDHPKGEAVNPMTRQELYEKFEHLCAPVFGLTETRSLRDEIMSLEDAPSVTSVVSRLRT